MLTPCTKNTALCLRTLLSVDTDGFCTLFQYVVWLLGILGGWSGFGIHYPYLCFLSVFLCHLGLNFSLVCFNFSLACFLALFNVKLDLPDVTYPFVDWFSSDSQQRDVPVTPWSSDHRGHWGGQREASACQRHPFGMPEKHTRDVRPLTTCLMNMHNDCLWMFLATNIHDGIVRTFTKSVAYEC